MPGSLCPDLSGFTISSLRLALTERPIHERPQRNKSCAEQNNPQRPTGRFGARGDEADEHRLADFGLEDLREGMAQAAHWQVHAQRANHRRRDLLRLLKPFPLLLSGFIVQLKLDSELLRGRRAVLTEEGGIVVEDFRLGLQQIEALGLTDVF